MSRKQTEWPIIYEKQKETSVLKGKTIPPSDMSAYEPKIGGKFNLINNINILYISL